MKSDRTPNKQKTKKKLSKRNAKRIAKDWLNERRISQAKRSYELRRNLVCALWEYIRFHERPRI